jgi:hypothetical protein
MCAVYPVAAWLRGLPRPLIHYRAEWQVKLPVGLTFWQGIIGLADWHARDSD